MGAEYQQQQYDIVIKDENPLSKGQWKGINPVFLISQLYSSQNAGTIPGS